MAGNLSSVFTRSLFCQEWTARRSFVDLVLWLLLFLDIIVELMVWCCVSVARFWEGVELVLVLFIYSISGNTLADYLLRGSGKGGKEARKLAMTDYFMPS